jgi:hypothetical protein
LEQLGAVAGKQYDGDGLSVAATPDGARLRCVFQRLEGEATFQGLWLTSTFTNLTDRFRVEAVGLGRKVRPESSNRQPFTSDIELPEDGVVGVEGQKVRFIRPGLVEEYSVSMDGVRQDYIVTQRPAGAGELVLNLGVTGANVEKATYGARLLLTNSGRGIAYSRLRAADAAGKSLPARMDVWSTGADTRILVSVNDTGAVYPVRIDPTFSDANWISMGGVPGVDGGVYAAVVDGLGNLYIGGSFSHAGTVAANGVARWNGSEWSALGAGMNGTVWALTISGGTLYAGGDFTTADGSTVHNIAQWSGSAWLPLGSGMNGPVWALAVSGKLYAGGSFSRAGSNAVSSLVQWDGVHWSGVGDASPGFVYALAVSGTKLYAAGSIQISTNFQDVVGVAQYDGTNWSRLGNGGLFGTPLALAASGGTLYVGGEFTQYEGTNSDGSPDVVILNYIGKWDGSTWSGLGSGMSDRVQSLAVAGGVVYAGGQFTAAGGAPANYIAQWNNGLWSAMDVGAGGNVQALVASGGVLFAGGGFTSVGGTPAGCIAQWNGGNWSALGSGLLGSVEALAVSGGTLYAGGFFGVAGTNGAKYIAQWNGSGWSALGTGVNGEVAALAASGGKLYAGGAFTTAGSNTANHIAQWNGGGWSALGPGMNGNVLALAAAGNTLYAGGAFTTAGTNTAGCIARWNGTNWSALGSGVNSNVLALTLSGNTLYAGGAFTMADTNTAECIAQWNGTNWSGLGSGMGATNCYVAALAAAGGTLYAGGHFATAGGNAATNIAQWNGTNWLALGTGMTGIEFPPYLTVSVNALAVSGGTLYAGGSFRGAGGIGATNIAQWDGGNWSALGSGVNSEVQSLAVSGGSLYVGGIFTSAGTNVSSCIADAIIGGAPVGLAIITKTPAFGFTNGFFGFDVSGPSGSNVVIQAGTNLQTWIPLKTNLLNGGMFHFSDPQTATKRRRFYRAQLLP